jgi:hypothetical protein
VEIIFADKAQLPGGNGRNKTGTAVLKVVLIKVPLDGANVV